MKSIKKQYSRLMTVKNLKFARILFSRYVKNKDIKFSQIIYPVRIKVREIYIIAKIKSRGIASQNKSCEK